MLLFALACAPDQDVSPIDDGSETVEPVDEPTPYVLDEGDEELPLLGPEQLRWGIEDALSTVFTLDPVLLQGAYESLRYGDSTDCPYYYPGYYDLYGYDYWVDTCTSDSGWTFAGNGRSYAYAPYVDGYYAWDYRNYFYGAARIDTPEGETLVASGYATSYAYTNTSNGYRYHYAYLNGDFRWDGAPGTWLAEDLAVSLVTYGYQSPAGGTSMSLDGSLTGLQGDVNTVVFDGVFLFDEVLASPCPLEPSGVISLRDDEGQWYDVQFDGPDSGATAMWAPDCDGCGQAWQGGESVGQVCPSFDRMIIWPGSRPW